MTQLYFWGANSHLQSGSRISDEQFNTPIVVDFLEIERIASICGGGGHTIIVTDTGKAFAVGWNHKGQLGVGGFKDSSTFLSVKTDTHIIDKIRCGWDITAFITVNNEVFMCGNNQYEQFGSKEPRLSDIPVPVNPVEGSEITDLTFGLRHTTLLTSTGKVFLCGQSRCVRIAEEMRHTRVKSRKFLHNGVQYLEMEFGEAVSLITSGQHFTLAYTCDHHLFLIGENKHVSIQNQEIDVSHVPLIREITCGWTHFAFIDFSGVAYTGGRNNYHQLGRKSATHDVIGVVNVPERVENVRCGSEHCLVLTESGKILTWGWNEHGNCGVNGVEDVKTPTEVMLSGKCVMIGTGYGFNFAIITR